MEIQKGEKRKEIDSKRVEGVTLFGFVETFLDSVIQMRNLFTNISATCSFRLQRRR